MKEAFEKDEQDQNDGDDGGGDAVEAVLDDSAGDSAFVVAEEKQPLGKGTVAMFVILALCGAGVYFMYVRTGPQTAAASVDPKAKQVISKYMTDRDKNLAGMKKMLQDTESRVRQFRSYPSLQQVPLGELTGNPFRIAPPETGNKSVASQTLDAEREKKKREEERVAVLKAVNTLQLQSVMSGGQKASCMINNSLYTEGQQIEEFVIEKINPNAVVVRNGSYRFELRMQR